MSDQVTAASAQPGLADQFGPASRVRQHSVELASRDASAPSALVADRDRLRSFDQASVVAGDDIGDVLVDDVERILGSAVACVAEAVGFEVEAGGCAGAEDDAGVGRCLESDVGDRQRQGAGRGWDDALGAADANTSDPVGTGLGPGERCLLDHRGQPEAGHSLHPGVGSGRHDAPTLGLGDDGVVVVVRVAVGVGVGPRGELGRARLEDLVDSHHELGQRDHRTIVIDHRWSCWGFARSLRNFLPIGRFDSGMKPTPAASSITPGWFPTSPVAAGHVEPAPRRVRAIVDGHTVVDTLAAQYVWEHPWYPQFYVPADDVDESFVARTGEVDDTYQPGAEAVDLITSSGAVRAGCFVAESANPKLVGTYRFVWAPFDAWLEEDEVVFGHPRSPYVRVDAIRSDRPVHVHADGVTLARASSSIAVFETGLPPRWYVDRSTITWEHLEAIELRTLCPYKGRTTGYWNAEVAGRRIDEAAWSYEDPVREVGAIAGLVAFDDAKVTVEIG